MSRADIYGLVLSYVYAFGLLFGVEAVGKRLKWPQWVTRKLVHIGAGMWVWGILYFFTEQRYGIIPFATFIVLNYIFYRLQAFKAMDAQDATLGTVYFAISITILFGWLWRTDGSSDRVPLAAAAVMAMTWGDALASLVGKKWGRHRYNTFGHQRTWEGSLTMLVSSFVVILLTLWLLPGSNLSPNSISPPALWLLGATAALIATGAEAFSPAGTDNLTVPLLTALFLVAGEEFGNIPLVQNLLLGLLISLLIGVGSYLKGALSLSGVLGAMLIGTSIFGFGGWVWGVLLITFYLSSTLLSHYKNQFKEQLAEKFAKGSRRDLGQTLANGGVSSLITLLAWWQQEPLYFAAFVGVLATVNADTWATELGVLSRTPPRLITNGKVVSPGTSGGVSKLGTVATVAGAMFIGVAALLLQLIASWWSKGGDAILDNWSAETTLALLPAATLGGLLGGFCDSFLGATVQAQYYSSARQKTTEREFEFDGERNKLSSGWRWLNNDWVNALSSIIGAMTALGIVWGLTK